MVGKLTSTFHRVNPQKIPITETKKDNLTRAAIAYCEAYIEPLDCLIPEDTYLEHLIKTKGSSFAQGLHDMHTHRDGDYVFEKGKRKAGTFTKWETYEEYKHLRHIQSMTELWSEYNDGFHLGRVFKSIETAFYAGPGNVKGLDKQGKREKLMSLGEILAVSDYSSYESSHTPEIQEAVFRPIYSYILQKLPDCDRLVDALMHVLTGKKEMDMDKHLTAIIESVEFSGDFCTALNNLALNIVALICIYADKGIPMEQSVNLFVCEGDDNVMNWQHITMCEKDFREYGLKAKFVTGNLTLAEAKFCQLLYCSDGVVLVDAAKKLASSVLVKPKYGKSGPANLKSLMRAQAMSMLYNHAGVPIVHNWALALLRLTSGVNVRKHHWESLSYNDDVLSIMKSDWRALAQKEITEEARVKYEEIFFVPRYTQILCEQLIDSWQGGVLDLPLEMPDVNLAFYEDNINAADEEDYEVPTYAREKYEEWFQEVLRFSST